MSRSEYFMRFLLVALALASLYAISAGGVKANEVVLTVSIEPIRVKITQADDCTLSWTAPTEREDGTPLSIEEIKSYTIYGGMQPGVYTREVLVTGTTEILCSAFEISEPSTWYFAGITTDTNGIHSELSNEITKMVRVINPPKAIVINGEIVIRNQVSSQSESQF